MFGIAIVLTYYTFLCAISVWKQENKFAGIVVGLIAISFIPMVIWLNFR